jgi:hypothetical protein
MFAIRGRGKKDRGELVDRPTSLASVAARSECSRFGSAKYRHVMVRQSAGLLTFRTST